MVQSLELMDLYYLQIWTCVLLPVGEHKAANDILAMYHSELMAIDLCRKT